MKERRSVTNILRGKSIGKRPLGRSRRRWEDNTRMYPKEIDFNEREYIDSAQDKYYWKSIENGHLTFGFYKPWSQINLGIELRTIL